MSNEIQLERWERERDRRRRVERVRETNEIRGESQERAKETCYSLLCHTLYGYNTVYGYNQ